MSTKNFLDDINLSNVPPPIAFTIQDSGSYTNGSHNDHSNYSDQHRDEPRNSPGHYTDHANHADSSKKT
jgi:hypothetical protein